MSLLGVVEHRENWCQKRSTKRPQTITLAPSGRISGGSMIFWWFWDRQRVGQNEENKIWSGQGRFPGQLWGGSASRRCPLKLFRASLESWMNSGTGSCTLVPWQAMGGGYLWATASSADLRFLACVSGDLDCEFLDLCSGVLDCRFVVLCLWGL